MLFLRCFSSYITVRTKAKNVFIRFLGLKIGLMDIECTRVCWREHIQDDSLVFDEEGEKIRRNWQKLIFDQVIRLH